LKVLVTGAAGFLGSRLIRELLSGAHGSLNVTSLIAADTSPCPVDDRRIQSRIGSIADPAFVASIVEADVAAIVHLAAVLSGQSEADFDVGLRVNLDGTRALLEGCRARAARPRFVFSSTVAVFGGRLPAVVPETEALRPQTSYGTEKAMVELLVSEYSRRGFIDAVVCRLATVTVRPGQSNSALSSFVSGIIREPIAGVETVCPVPLDTRLWISSPRTVTANLLHAGSMNTAALGQDRVLNLPGISVTAGEMLDSLERLAGREARARVRVEREERVAAAMLGWPAALDASRALSLGFVADTNVDAIVREYLDERSQR
jgi:nucleoside-diphosphate-sugar epimerase